MASWFHGRFLEPWQRSPPRIKRYVRITFLGVLLAFVGDTVYWYETGHGFFHQEISRTPIDPVQPFLETSSVDLFAYSSLMLWWVLPGTGWERLVVGLFTLKGIALAYLALTTGHPIPIASAPLVLAGTLVWGRDRWRGSEDG